MCTEMRVSPSTLGRRDYATGLRGPWTPLRVPEVISTEQPIFLRDTSGKINTKFPSLRRHWVFSEGVNILQLPNDFLRYEQTQRSHDHPCAPHPGPQQPVLIHVEHWFYIFSKTYAFGNINQVLWYLNPFPITDPEILLKTFLRRRRTGLKQNGMSMKSNFTKTIIIPIKSAFPVHDLVPMMTT